MGLFLLRWTDPRQVQGMSSVLTCLAASGDMSSCSEPEFQAPWPRDIECTGGEKEDMVAARVSGQGDWGPALRSPK